MIEALARRIADAVAEPVALGHAPCRIGASIGYTFASSSEATADLNLIEADLALYEAKHAGRRPAFAYSAALATEIETRKQLFEDINDALTEGQFEVFIQLQVYTQNGSIYGCEVLARWRHPSRGLVSPAHLTVEVPESALIENDDDAALHTVENLSRAGFKLVLYDFGTGYASVSNLSRRRLDRSKLDQSLFKPVPEPRANSIISALVTLSRSVNMSIVAEGVETPEHYASVENARVRRRARIHGCKTDAGT